jgi:hypothetical protein
MESHRVFCARPVFVSSAGIEPAPCPRWAHTLLLSCTLAPSPTPASLHPAMLSRWAVESALGSFFFIAG